MKHLMTLLALVVAVTAGAQTATWNPDYNGDSIIGVDDLLGLLSAFGIESFESESQGITIDLVYWNDGTLDHVYYDIPANTSQILSRPSTDGTTRHYRLATDSVLIGQEIQVIIGSHVAWSHSGSIVIEKETVEGWQGICGWWKSYSSYTTGCWPYDCQPANSNSNSNSSIAHFLRVKMTEDGWIPMESSFLNLDLYEE